MSRRYPISLSKSFPMKKQTIFSSYTFPDHTEPIYTVISGDQPQRLATAVPPKTLFLIALRILSLIAPNLPHTLSVSPHWSSYPTPH